MALCWKYRPACRSKIFCVVWTLGLSVLVTRLVNVACETPYQEYIACIKDVSKKADCSKGPYGVGDTVTGSIPNCVSPFMEPGKPRPTIKLLQPNNAVTNGTVIPLVANISRDMGYPLGVNVVESVDWTREPLREFTQGSPTGVHDAWFLDPVLTADMADEPVGALLDLSNLVQADKNLQWSGFSTFFRRVASVYDGKIIGLPVSAAIMLMYYRRDFFDARGIPVPATWEEVVEIAERYNGTDLDGSGRGAWGFCMPRQPRCYNGYVFQALQVPFLQTQGTSQGFHFDLDTMTPLVNSSGTRRAAELYRRLSPYMAPTESVGCLPVSLSFVHSECLIAVGSTLQFKYAEFNNTMNKQTLVRGKTGTALLPGSTQVMDRRTGRLVPCDEERCPHGKLHRLMNGTELWINSAPYAGRGALTYAINRHRRPELQYMAYRMCARRTYPEYMWQSVLSPTAETTPVRSDMVDPSNLGNYTAAGFHESDTRLFIAAVSKTVESSNVALNLRIGGAIDYYMAVDAAAVALTDTNRSIDDVLAEAQAKVAALYANVSREWLKQRYYKSIDLKSGPETPPPRADAAPSRMGSATKIGIGVGVGVGGALLLLAAIILFFVAFRSLTRRKRSKVYLPYGSTACTIVVTDVQDSTALWESLPSSVMQAAMRQHDAVLRTCVAKHGGYETATEGDSFIVAFPHPAAALRCCAELQSALLAAAWPPELLQHAETCYPVHASPRAPREQQAQLATRFGSHGTFVAPGHRSLSASSLASTFHQSACSPHRPDTGTGLIPDSGPSARGRAARTLILNQHLSHKQLQQLQLHPWQHSLSHAASEEPAVDSPAQRNSCASSALAVSRSGNLALSGLVLQTCRSGGGFARMPGRVAFPSPRARPELPGPGTDSCRGSNSRSGRVGAGLGGSAADSNGRGSGHGTTQQLAILIPDQQFSSPPDSCAQNAQSLPLERTSIESPWGAATAAAAAEAAAAASLDTATGLDGEDVATAERLSFMMGSVYCSRSTWQQQQQQQKQPFEEFAEATFKPMIGGSTGAAAAAAAAPAATFPADAADTAAQFHSNPSAPTDPAAAGSPLGTSPATVTFTLAPTTKRDRSSLASHASTPSHLSHAAISREPATISRPTSPMPSGPMYLASQPVNAALTADSNVFYSTPCVREGSTTGGPRSNLQIDVGSLQPPQRPRSLARNSTSFGFGLSKLHSTASSLPGTLASLRKIVRLPDSGSRARSTGGGALPRVPSSGPARSVSIMGAAPPLGGLGSGFGGGGARGDASRPQVSLWSWGNELQAAWTVQREPEAGSVPVYRGLRVRCGLHSGVLSSELRPNAASSRVTISGNAIRTAKAVSDAAQGGMVTVSEASAALLLLPDTAAALAEGGLSLLHLGRVVLAEGAEPAELFQLLTPALAPRLAMQPARLPRLRQELLPGCFTAPAGPAVTLVQLQLSGLASLRADSPGLVLEVKAAVEKLLLATLPPARGYLSVWQPAEGMLVAAFGDAVRAVVWALCVQEELLYWDWSAEMLQHEACAAIELEGGGPELGVAADAGVTVRQSDAAPTAGANGQQGAGGHQHTLLPRPKSRAVVGRYSLDLLLPRGSGGGALPSPRSPMPHSLSGQPFRFLSGARARDAVRGVGSPRSTRSQRLQNRSALGYLGTGGSTPGSVSPSPASRMLSLTVKHPPGMAPLQAAPAALSIGSTGRTPQRTATLASSCTTGETPPYTPLSYTPLSTTPLMTQPGDVDLQRSGDGDVGLATTVSPGLGVVMEKSRAPPSAGLSRLAKTTSYMVLDRSGHCRGATASWRASSEHMRSDGGWSIQPVSPLGGMGPTAARGVSGSTVAVAAAAAGAAAPDAGAAPVSEYLPWHAVAAAAAGAAAPDARAAPVSEYLPWHAVASAAAKGQQQQQQQHRQGHGQGQAQAQMGVPYDDVCGLNDSFAVWVLRPPKAAEGGGGGRNGSGAGASAGPVAESLVSTFTILESARSYELGAEDSPAPAGLPADALTSTITSAANYHGVRLLDAWDQVDTTPGAASCGGGGGGGNGDGDIEVALTSRASNATCLDGGGGGGRCSSGAVQQQQQQLVFRGPRVRAAIELGPATAEISPSTGRVVYRQGRAAKGLAKVAAFAKSGQVVCTSNVARAAPELGALGVVLAPVSTAHSGRMRVGWGAGRATAGKRGAGLAGDAPVSLTDEAVAPGASGKQGVYYLCTMAATPLPGA